ncbi:hypothetical protein PR048_003625 [Dryococelus australis]|uniref:Uncharacterized protein n=1 Tax=Dryococelus australis TaxID=614101 RepID=A0ABQ9INJ4_9NEOP|nr:hypothetical protein PR048_003625 [Dryococelus australis]
MGDPRKNPPASGIVRHGSHMQKSGGDPTGNLTRFALVGGELSLSCTTAAPIMQPASVDSPCPQPTRANPPASAHSPKPACDTLLPLTKHSTWLAKVSRGNDSHDAEVLRGDKHDRFLSRSSGDVCSVMDRRTAPPSLYDRSELTETR